MSLEKVQQALLTRYKTIFPSPTYATAWENVAITPPTGAPWFSFRFVPVTSKIVSLGPNGYDEENGYVQVDINVPALAGEASLRSLFTQLRTCFPSASSLIYGGQSVSILSVSRSGGSEVDGFYRIACTVRWKAQVPRQA